MAALVLDGIQVKRPRCAEAAQQGYANATELADYLVAKGVPFREAHHIVGEAVVEAIAQGKPLEALTGRSAEIQPGDCGRCVSDPVAAVLPRETRSERRRLAAAGSPGYQRGEGSFKLILRYLPSLTRPSPATPGFFIKKKSGRKVRKSSRWL